MGAGANGSVAHAHGDGDCHGAAGHGWGSGGCGPLQQVLVVVLGSSLGSFACSTSSSESALGGGASGDATTLTDGSVQGPPGASDGSAQDTQAWATPEAEASGARAADSSAVSEAGGPGVGAADSTAADSVPADSGVGPGLAARYPGDLDIARDPAVVWAELFDEGSVTAFVARYESTANPAAMTLVADAPSASGSHASIKLTSSGDGANATDFYKELKPGYSEWFVRWYAKYESSIQWHHTGVWFGGYNPPIAYPFPRAGLKPSGTDLFSVSIEPVWGVASANAAFDFYNYWMNMHSWMAVPSGPTAYYGNALVNRNEFTIDENKWVCLEVHVTLNSNPTTSAGGVLEVWKNDTLVQSFTQAGPNGYWTRDKFCTMSADGMQCTSYPAPFDTVLDLQWRSTNALQLNYFWPQNYITQAGVTGSVQYANMIVATARVGCIR